MAFDLKRTLNSLKRPGKFNYLTDQLVTYTMWYDYIEGTIYAFGNSRPRDTYNDNNVTCTQVLYTEESGPIGPTPELAYFAEKPAYTPGLEKALEAIKEYRIANTQ